jgi:hypothetical protein
MKLVPLIQGVVFEPCGIRQKKKKKTKKMGDHYQKEYFRELNGLKDLNSSRMVFAILAVETLW